MKRRSTPTLVYDRGKNRLAVWLGWDFLRFKWGWRDEDGYIVAGFGFGMFTYLRRNYSK